MSDEISSNQSILCTSEDAFEKFQAGSMYEEDEFISLSDIVTPQPTVPDFSGELNEIPCGNEVVLESLLEEQVPEVNSTIEIGTEEHVSSDRPEEHPATTEDVPQATESIESESRPLKRGRKKKCQPKAGKGSSSDQNELPNVASQDNEAIASTPAPPRKRGRPARNARQSQQNNVAANPPVIIPETSNGSKRNKRESLSSEKTPSDNGISIDTNMAKNTPGRRRGRPKRNVSEQPQTEDSNMPELKDKDITLNNTPDITEPVQTKKQRGRKKQLVVISDEAFQKLNIVKEKCARSGDSSLNDTTVDLPIKKGKGGRPKKIMSEEEESEQVLEESGGTNEKILEEIDDDGDDICLSKLKNSIEKVKDSNMESNEEVIANIEKCTEKHASPGKPEVGENIQIKDSQEVSINISDEVIHLEEEKEDKKDSINRNSKLSSEHDFESNIDSVTNEKDHETNKSEDLVTENEEHKDSLLVEDTSKRPVRRKAKKLLHYDEGSDEDPFANIELSDEDDMRGRKGRYYSDDEYIPGLEKKRGSKNREIDTDTSDSDIDQIIENDCIASAKRKRCRKSDGSPNKKRGRKSKEELVMLSEEKTSGRFSPEVSTIKPDKNNEADDDVEICLETSVIKTPSEAKSCWGRTNEFENFLAKKIQGTDIKIKKASTPMQPLEIPVLDLNEAKKTIEVFTQTNEIPTKSTGIQTTTTYDVPMTSNVSLTAEQSEKACEFLNNIVKTTAELGELMTQKSEDFIKKKINTTHVTDTFKMDYCVRKSFLLFKLAKHNLMQMEEDLAKQYDNFLETQNLSQYREKPKVLEAEVKAKDSDSDCEIIETPAPKKKVPFNPKTVFLNKELSIKIAKKPTDDKKINIKGRHTVWINDSVMVKKVKPTQSFLAQDSRNKKPPDYVTIEMVNAFFEVYHREKVKETCAAFVSPEWLTHQSVLQCNYFFATTEELPTTGSGIASGSGHCQDVEDEEVSPTNINDTCYDSLAETTSPKTLLTLCTKVLQNHLHIKSSSTLNSLECKGIPHSIHNPESLFRLCVITINKGFLWNNEIIEKSTHFAPSSLNNLCHKKILEVLYKSKVIRNSSCLPPSHSSQLTDYISDSTDEADLANKYGDEVKPLAIFRRNGVKSLFSICFELVNTQFQYQDSYNNYNDPVIMDENKELAELKYSPKCLRSLAYNLVVKLVYKNENKPIEKKKVKTLADLCFEKVTKAFTDSENQISQDGLTINAVNTLTEEAYHNIDQSELSENGDDYYPDDNDNIFDEETDSGINNFTNHVEDNWLSQVQMKISSCYDPNNSVVENTVEEPVNNSFNSESILTRIKLEPAEEPSEAVDISIVKSEPMPHLDEMTIIPESIVTKAEYLDPPTTSKEPIHRQNSSSVDGEQFEAFVSTNKMMYNMNNYENEDEIFSQSTSRVRRQYEPDSDTENDMTHDNLGLLIPQTYEPMPVIEKDKAKTCLMESSSDENSSSSNKKPIKKKPERRTRKRPKNNDSKPAMNKETTKDKPAVSNEIAILTRKMREKIRQEEKKVMSSDSDNENDKITTKKGKLKTNTDKSKSPQSEQISEPTEASAGKLVPKETKSADDEIQCSNVDSTAQENDLSASRDTSPSVRNFNGFTALDQNEISSYQKYVKYVYDKIIPKDSDEDEKRSLIKTDQPLINPDEPVELLECEPTMPFFMTEYTNPSRTTATKRGKTATKEEVEENTASNSAAEDNSLSSKKTTAKRGKSLKKVTTDTVIEESDKNIEPSKANTLKEDNQLYVERHGWKCYPLNGNDCKLYQNAQILLEKLPESFVETYFRYQDLAQKDQEDEEVDRLINLQSLNKSSAKDGEPGAKLKCKGKPKCKIQPQVKDAVFSILGLNAGESVEVGTASPTCSSPAPPSPTNSDHCHEFTPSEDEEGKVEDEVPPTVAKSQSDNILAKNLLMNDKDSDDENKIKEEPHDTNEEDVPKAAKKYKPGPKSKKMKEKPQAGPVMLTADKMMNKELNLLHAPVNISEGDAKIKTPVKSGPVTRNSKNRNASKTTPKERVKNEDDSSSEEEKQWFTIKEKLLKRMVKKSDTTREDDAKRAKLVSEYIERRGDGTESYLKKRGRGGRRPRSKKKLLERQKQLRVLTRELFGDPSNDASLQRKKQPVAYFKGRRNIRKVIDKKSLAKSTVVANMEEFERKRRINIRQNKLKEILRCEDGVNVLVINDELCLEYDFEQHRPVVTVHPFFTKVMKAHQYEGVKFMWDACFESLESIAAGQPGGGCILAHCMGLGKTLQVLALLHTVLTHPGVGMQRVLVCCPLSTVLNWVDEIHKWIGPVTNQIKVFELSKLKKTYERAYQLEDWYNGGGIFIIGYELFRSLTTLDPYLDDVRPTIINKIRTALLEPGPDIIICDEGHLLKNDCSVLAVAMSRVATRRRVVLTGTPMQNNLREYYCMVNFVKPNLLGTYAEYSNRFENPIMNGQHRDSREEDIKLMKARTHILHKVLEGCLQRQEASVLYPYLPKKFEYTVFISLTKCQWDLYKHYLENYGNTQNNKSILKDFHILQKIWSHPQVLHNFQMRVCDEANKAKLKVKAEKLEDDLASEDLKEKEEDVKPSDREVWWLQYLEGGAMLDSLASSNKFVAVFRILDECVALGDKVLIFSTSLFTMDTLEFFLKKINKWSLGQEYYRLDGSVPAEVRQKWCREFNAEHNVKTRLFLISTRAGSLGLNMTAANRVIILDTSWNPAHDIQSIFRVYRFGQKKDCFIYRLVALGTMEQKIYERSVTKQAVACRVVDEQQIDRHYNMADLTELYKYDERGSGVAGGVAVGVEDVALLRVARDAALHAVHEHDSLLRGEHEQSLPEHERTAAWLQFQQEHATEQMHEDAFQQALLAQKLKAEEETAERRPPRKDAKPKPPPAAVKTEEPTPPAPAPAPPARPRGRRPRLSSVVSCRIPIQPETPDEPAPPAAPAPPDLDPDVVRRIADILLRHNFQDRKTPAEIAELVARVRRVVAGGRVDLLDASDALTMSIAGVLLRRDGDPAPAPVEAAPGPSTPRAVAAEAPLARGRGRPRGSGRGRVGRAEEPSTSAAPPAVLPEARGSRRTRRRAALVAERNFEEGLAEAAIDPGDSEWRSDTDSDSAPISAIKKAQDGPATVRPLRPEVKVEPETGPPANLQGATSAVIEESIVLSDDDEAPPPPKKPGPAGRTRRGPKSLSEDASARKPATAVIPLHPTLLSNKNFIKIVAHTYLSGNPMLDEDAATLAAQYSTFKALKEYAMTGKDIMSGPLHDIAVQVLGISVLQVLHESKTEVDTNQLIDAHPINTKAEVAPKPAPPPEEPPPPAPQPDRRGPVKIKIRIPPLPANLAAAGDAPAAPPDASVVPVGLYKRAEEGPNLAADECILPDDDDVRIVADPAPAAPPAPAPPAPPPAPAPGAARPPPRIVLNRRNATPLVIKSVTAVRSAPVAPPPVAPVAPAEEILSDLPAAISLDSDDDEPQPPPPRVALPVVAPRPGPAPPPRPGPAPGVMLVPSASLRAQPPPAAPPAAPRALLLRGAGPSPAMTRLAGPTPAPASTRHAGPAPAPTPIRLVGPTPAPTSTRLAGPALAPAPPPPAARPEPGRRVCKPGDILRITERGDIEVLQLRTLPPPTPSPLQRPSGGPPPPPAASGSSGPRRGGDDPLSILRDVVHIEADDYEVDGPPPTRAAAKPAGARIAEAPSPGASGGEPGPSGPDERRPRKVYEAKPRPTSIPKPVESHNREPRKSSLCSTKREIPVDLTMDDPPPSSTESSAKKLKGATTIVGTSKSIVLCGTGKAIAKTNLGAVKRDSFSNSVDLSATLNNKVEKSIAKTNSGAVKRDSFSNSVDRTATLNNKVEKAIAKTNSGAVKRDSFSNSVDLTATLNNKVESNRKLIFMKNKPEVKKRPMTAATPAIKKKKTDEPMTLKDFNIDDFDDLDDIIELE